MRGGKMRLNRLLILIAIVFGTTAVAQDDSAKPKISKDQLTTEQVAIYRAVLTNYVKGSDGTLNVSNRTDPPDFSFDNECMRGIVFEKTKDSVPTVHKLSSAVLIYPKMILVNPEQQLTKVKDNDPGNLVNKTIEGRQRVTKKQLDKAVEQAFVTGLFSLSEIVFDKLHRHAIVSYGFVCGGLCGHGGTLILEKVGDMWKVQTTCSSWIS
jgi:hypothetical protein